MKCWSITAITTESLYTHIPDYMSIIIYKIYNTICTYTNNGTGEHAVVRDPINSFRINSMVMVLAITSNIAQLYGRTCIDSRHMHVAISNISQFHARDCMDMRLSDTKRNVCCWLC